MVFAAVFLICYLYHQPTQAGGKAAGLALLNMVMGVTDEQTYNFLNVANLAVVLVLVFAVLAVATHFPVSFRAEHVFLRLLGRFFRACAYLASALQWDPANPPTRWQRLRRVLHLGDLANRASSRSGQVCCRRRPWVNPRPSRCRRWSTACKPLPIACKTCLRPARHRNRKCLRANCFPRCAWRAGLQDIFCNLSQQPEAADFADFRSRLDAMLERLEEQIEKAVAGEDQASLATPENEDSIRLLGAFRGVSEEVVNFARQSGGIDWARLA